MSIKLYDGVVNIEYQTSRFPAGETCIRLTRDFGDVLDIWFKFENNGELFDLALLVDAIRRNDRSPVRLLNLYMPYLPYARQDRVCNPGESLSVKVVCDHINALKFDSVVCFDIHSEVGVALLNNLKHRKQAYCAGLVDAFCKAESTALVSPDAGAEKKVFDVAKQLGYTSVIRASKVRNVATGKIERTTLLDPLCMPYDGELHKFLIVDDICDGGRTFIELAKTIKEDKMYRGQPIHLYVTHGIFSAGMNVFDGYIDHIYVRNLMNGSVKNHPLITEI